MSAPLRLGAPLLVGAAAAAVVGYLFRIHEGREFLEQPLPTKLGIVVVALGFKFQRARLERQRLRRRRIAARRNA